MRVGNENRSDLWIAPPDMETKDTPGAQLIIDTLLDEDPRPVHVLSWGGANTTASALWKLQDPVPSRKSSSMRPRESESIASGTRTVEGKWIEENIPEAYINEAYRWDNVWDYESYERCPQQRQTDRQSACSSKNT